MSTACFSNHLEGFSASQPEHLLTSALLFGTSASWMFLSFISVQVFTYFRHSKKDSRLLKTLVYTITVLQILQTGTDSYSAYVADSAGWGDPNAINGESFIIPNNLQPIFSSLTGFIVQCFFTWRIWMFPTAFIRHSYIRVLIRLVCAFIFLVGALSLIAAFTIGILSTFLAEFPPWFGIVLPLWIISSAVVDVTITLCMAALLLHAKANSYFGETRDLLSRLIRIVLQTGLLTTVLALLILLLYVKEEVGMYGLPAFVLGKTYVISLLANLNARLHRSDDDQGVLVTKESTLVFTPSIFRAEEDGKNGPVDFPYPIYSSPHRKQVTIRAAQF